LGPIFGALSASVPIFKGQLANWDFRWNCFSKAIDCRTEEEKDPTSSNYNPKPRCSSTNHYLSDHPYFGGDKLNDGYKFKINQDWYKKLKESGMSDRLAYHFAALFYNDSMGMFKSMLENTGDFSEQFELFNSTSWTSVKFKPPPSLDSLIGWRVEFRTLDIQITDFENAAYIALLNLTTRVLNDFDINLSLPISM
jgi:glutamate--cysteine ligase catalytic subunit